jgi:hypothetical protein
MKTIRTDHPMRRLATANIAIAVVSLGLSIALGFLLPLPVYKVLVGFAIVVAVVAIGAMIYRRFGHPQAPVVEEAPDGR